MMDSMRDGFGMMWGIGLGHLFVLIILALVIAALVKYVFFGENRRFGASRFGGVSSMTLASPRRLPERGRELG
jgi:hypothetical protein